MINYLLYGIYAIGWIIYEWGDCYERRTQF